MSMTKMQQILNAKAEYEKTVADLGKAAVAEELKGLFDAYPELTAVRWRQYTPYFNDGDPCVFRLRDVLYKTSTDKVAGEEARDEEDDYYEGFSELPWRQEERSTLQDSLQTFEKNRVEDLYKDCFGDHVTVTATRDGVEVQEYEHE